MLARVDAISDDIAALDARIEEEIIPFAGAVARLDEIPGISLAAAHVILAEIGTDMTRFPTAGHLVSWARLAPGVKESAGKKKGKGSTGHGNAYLAAVLGNAAAGAAKTDTFPGERYRRIARRRGSKRAIVAVGRSILVIAWHLLSDPEARFHDLGPGFLRHPHRPRTPQARPHPPARSPRLQSHPPASPLTCTTTSRLRCAPPGTAARPLTLQFSD
jgi:transposase